MAWNLNAFKKAHLASDYGKMTIRVESIRLSYWVHVFRFYGLLNPQSHVNSVKSTGNTFLSDNIPNA
jgi:hypothetical protein